MRRKYQYTHNRAWFLQSNLYRQLLKFVKPKEKHTILEIGSYEGLSACYFSDTILSHPESTLDCVDPYLRFTNNDHANLLNSTQTEKMCRANIAKSAHGTKVTLHTVTSDAYFKSNSKQYDFIYIDGCHLPEYIDRDMENSWNILHKQGIMWMDDYLGGPKGDDSIKRTMEVWMKRHAGEFVVVWKAYQLALRKCN